MYDRQANEIREALLAVLSTAASMGIDVELLGHLAAAELLDEQAPGRNKIFAAGAVYELGVCMGYVTDPDDSSVL
ncbi:hypothetical protein [Pseudomonas syringae group sp. J309-1]|uniref:hypothetical protein n=1 Tax=Pseudomonas syringae group sp. J309-1 TaxID=3079588 RepID=UPI00290E7F3A|nr:hypothetical protein [Pseudomonas syringae group sp. J309-1]MDU8357957.1 hypothetical protein [Pseudomonas syringae group sp. J309-1]